MKVKRFVKAFLIASGLFLLIIGLGILDELIFQHTGCRVVLPVTLFVIVFLVAYTIIDRGDSDETCREVWERMMKKGGRF